MPSTPDRLRILHCIALASTFALASSSFADRPPPFSSTDRFVSVVQAYGGSGSHWTVWAVQRGSVIVYEQSGFSGVEDKLLGTFTISPTQEAEIRSAAAALLRELKGRMWFSPDVMDGVSLSIRFTRDGSYRSDGIEIENVWRPEFHRLCACISAILPTKLKITFEDIVNSRPDQARLKVVETTVAERRVESTSRAKQ